MKTSLRCPMFGAVAMAVAGCSQPNSAVPANSSTSTTAAVAPAVEHYWSSEDGGEYAYVSALSADDKAAGRAAAKVFMFRYLGESEGGVFTVESVDGDMRTAASCRNPCSIVKLVETSYFTRETTHVTFDETSVVGEALTDAMNGEMAEYHQVPPSTPTSSCCGAANDAAPTAPANATNAP